MRAAGSAFGCAVLHELGRDMLHARKSHVEHGGDSGLRQCPPIGLASVAILMPR